MYFKNYEGELGEVVVILSYKCKNVTEKSNENNPSEYTYKYFSQKPMQK